MSQSAVELPLYNCHKQVRAAKITGLGPATSDTTVLQFDNLHASTKVTVEWALKHKPQIGSYYVVYADGYASCSPAQPFEDGYTLAPTFPA